MAWPKTKQQVFRYHDQKWWDQEHEIENSVVDFFVNPPEGVEHGQKSVESKNGQHFYFKNF